MNMIKLDIKRLYVDASCDYRNNVCGYAIVGDGIQKSGIVSCDVGRVNSGYCELYAVYQALQLINDNKRVNIYTDNEGLVRWLRKDVCDKKNGRQNYNELLRVVHPFYHKLKNVRIYKINRKHNKIADKLAKKALKGDYNV